MANTNISGSRLGEHLSHIGEHEKRLRKLANFDCIHPLGGAVFPRPLYLMAFTNRCGSNLLADYINQTGLIGGFHESLNFDTISSTADREGIDNISRYFYFLHERFAKQETLGVKASWDQILMLARFNVFSMFPAVRVVHIRRAEVVSQAVSHWIAHQTKRWTSTMKGEQIEPEYDFSAIQNIVSNIQMANSIIPILSRVLGAAHVGVLYEGLVRDPQTTVVNVTGTLGLELGAWKASAPKINKQADKVNERFVARFYGDLAECVTII